MILIAPPVAVGRPRMMFKLLVALYARTGASIVSIESASPLRIERRENLCDVIKERYPLIICFISKT